MNQWTWKENSVLYNTSPYVPPREIFLAVCDEIGRYYQMTGAKYTKSNRKLKWSWERIRCEIGLWSSHHNIPGEWVNLEIVTSVYSLDTRGMERKGILNYSVRPNNFNVYHIDYNLFFEIIHQIDHNLEIVKTFETKEGVDNFLKEQSEGRLKFIEENPNNEIYYNRTFNP